MQLYCKTIAGVLTVLAAHVDGDSTPAAAYGEGIVILPYSGDLPLGDLLGKAAPAPDLYAYAAAKRYAVETGGITLNGARIDTSVASQAKIGNAYLLLQASGGASVEFKAESGFITLTADQFKTLALAVGGHVQACYAKEADVDAGVSAGTIKTLADIDAAFASLLAA